MKTGQMPKTQCTPLYQMDKTEGLLILSSADFLMNIGDWIKWEIKATYSSNLSVHIFNVSW